MHSLSIQCLHMQTGGGWTVVNDGSIEHKIDGVYVENQGVIKLIYGLWHRGMYK